MVLDDSFTLLLISFGHFKHVFCLYYEKIDWLVFLNYLQCTNTNFLNCWNKLFHTNPYPSRGCWDDSLSHLNCCGSWVYIFPYCTVDEAIRVHIDPVEYFVVAVIENVSVLGREEGYTVKYTPTSEGVPEDQAWGNWTELKAEGYIWPYIPSRVLIRILYHFNIH